jgi:predicted GNAT family acetyltransferase
MLKLLAEHLRQKGLKATASCSYANTWLKKNQATYSDIISEKLD